MAGRGRSSFGMRALGFRSRGLASGCLPTVDHPKLLLRTRGCLVTHLSKDHRPRVFCSESLIQIPFLNCFKVPLPRLHLELGAASVKVLTRQRVQHSPKPQPWSQTVQGHFLSLLLSLALSPLVLPGYPTVVSQASRHPARCSLMVALSYPGCLL